MTRELRARAELLGWALVLLACDVGALVLLVLVAVSFVLVTVWIGLPLLLALALAVRASADVRRRIAGRVGGRAVPRAYLTPSSPGFFGRVRDLAADRATWRDLVWLAVAATGGLVISIGAIVESLLGLLFWWLPRSLLARGHAELDRVLLSPGEQQRLAVRVQQLTASRAATADSSAAELRRIERDLHDGAQARLVALGMSLGLAEERLEADPHLARTLLTEARHANSTALGELRDLVRGIHPPVLADRGLDGAVRALALSGPLAVTVTGSVPRLPAPIESAVYFAVAEALTNVIKHSGATAAVIELGLAGPAVRAVVRDDGTGGADPGRGSGLRGMQRRLSAFDGTVTLSSPIGGPTAVELVVPCAS